MSDLSTHNEKWKTQRNSAEKQVDTNLLHEKESVRWQVSKVLRLLKRHKHCEAVGQNVVMQPPKQKQIFFDYKSWYTFTLVQYPNDEQKDGYAYWYL